MHLIQFAFILVDKLPVRSWLEEYKLKAYEDRILEENIKTIKCLKELKITDSLLDRLDIMVPGHRKRFTTSVQTLQTITAVHGEQESRGPFHPDAVAVGYWTRPQCLERLEHDFLCVKGCFKSRIEDDKQSELLEFLLDSASDVVTARREIIEGMGLEYIKDVDSHGVHTVAKKPLYKGQLKLGNSRWIDVEVSTTTPYHTIPYIVTHII
ncbi:hypothetical protein QZH41_014549 [Actinostola sp. cb2023]|nr:hypothetical protein QZH41_014549 [Actinostola sp. cb2023]